jgi:6-hydroxymethylpterin diphosphokinase MptE-like protein
MNVVSFYAPRPDHPFFQDYTPFLDLLRASCKRYGHRHIVITDDPVVGDDAFVVDLPHNLMKAFIGAQLAYLNSPFAQENTLFTGADCVLARDPASVFEQEFDIAFTVGPFADCLINTGAIFIRGGAPVRYIWERAYAEMGLEWGDDQKALAAVVKPTRDPSVNVADGFILRFLPVDPYNLAPEYPDDDCRRGYVLHFRGPRKAWMMDYCAKWLDIGDRIEWNVVSNAPKEKIFSNVAVNSRRTLPWVRELPPHDRHAVLIGGGPSAIDDLDEIRRRERQNQDIFALNGVAHWLAQYGIVPEYQVLLDSRPENRRFVRPPNARQFLIASQCDPAIFDLLRDEDVTLYHHHEEKIEDYIGKPSVLIGGGITVGLTTMALVFALGYRKLHLYGYDSSDREGESHAYEQAQAGAEADRRDTWLGRQKFSCSPAMYAQAKAFPAFAQLLADSGVTITVHGGGLLPAIARQAFGMMAHAA